MCEFEKLKKYLEKLESGEIENTVELEGMLANCWHEFNGGEDTEMYGCKLHRMENVTWNHPILSFVIERHGGTVLGSSRATLQYWDVDIEEETADNYEYGYRQVSPRGKSLYVKPLANEIVKKILAGEVDPRWEWSNNGDRVKVSIIKSIGGKKNIPKQTFEGRCRRFRDTLVDKMENEGWIRTEGYGVFFEKIPVKMSNGSI